MFSQKKNKFIQYILSKFILITLLVKYFILSHNFINVYYVRVIYVDYKAKEHL